MELHKTIENLAKNLPSTKEDIDEMRDAFAKCLINDIP
jgi:hypothetical protein